MSTSLTILIVDDQAESVEPLRQELTEQLSAICYVESFATAQAKLDEYRPAAVFLDLLRQQSGETPTLAADEIYNYIWKSRFCPLIIYSAEPDALTADTHPFVGRVRKGSGSEEAAVRLLQGFLPQVEALAKVERDIGEVLRSVLRDLAPKISADATFADVLMRAARRQIAARMDLARGEDGALAPWEQYIFPPLLTHLCTGDLLRLRNGNRNEPTSFRLVLSPSCDLVCSATRKPRLEDALVAKCGPPSDLIDAMQVGNAGPRKIREKLASILTRGFHEGLVPVPAFSDLVPEMCANLRHLELVKLTAIGDQDEEFTRVLSVDSPFRELSTWAFFQVLARPGLPDRDWQAWAVAISPDSEN